MGPLTPNLVLTRTDRSAVLALPSGRGRAAERASRIRRRAAEAAREQEGDADAVAIRLEPVGRGRAGMEEA